SKRQCYQRAGREVNMKGVRAVRGDREELRHFIQEFRAALNTEALTHPALAAKHKSQAG
ncbi:uncharacterized, partial [Tachysurus ichikawai]